MMLPSRIARENVGVFSDAGLAVLLLTICIEHRKTNMPSVLLGDEQTLSRIYAFSQKANLC